MWIPDFVLKLVGKNIAKEMHLEDGPMDENKKWYQSKGVWTGIVTFLLGLYQLIGTELAPNFHFSVPAIPDWIFVILGSLGVYSRINAEKKIG